MNFVQIEFILFLIALLVAITLTRSNTRRKALLLAASCYFYAYWDYRFLGLLLVPILVGFFVGRIMDTSESQRRRNALLVVILVINLGILGIFKYYNFFVESFVNRVLPSGLYVGTLEVILPLGISFYTFQTLSYTIDVFKRRIKACNSLLDYALFIAFFPKLVAGPITRPSNLLPQFQGKKPITVDNLAEGLRLFGIGMFKKVFVADRLALFVGPVFENSSVYSGATLWLGALAYTIQIYCDFAGYSDMAIGTARMFGYHLEKNFDFPYVSKSVSEFWRRWHITLSLWIKDYLYIPLGGSKKGPIRTYVNLMTAMVLCGLWHGAGLTFILWGGFHGFALSVNRIYRKVYARGAEKTDDTLAVLIKWALTMLTVIIGWVLFRAHDLPQALTILKRMFLYESGVDWVHPFVLLTLCGTIAIHVGESLGLTNLYHLPLKAWYTALILFCLVWLVLIFFPAEFTPFIYASF
jgi:alginate O-acetyltransferase complex protein AlgI